MGLIMKTTVITSPAAYPITTAEAVEYCKLFDDSYDTATLTMLIAAMTDYAEQMTGRAFVERTLLLTMNYFPSCVELPHAPLLEVESFEYLDVDDQLQTVSAADYEVDIYSEPAILRLKSGVVIPSISKLFNPVQIKYRAGYRPAGSPTDLTDNSYLPQLLRTWLAQRIQTLYDNRAYFIGGNFRELPRSYQDGLLDSLKLGTRFF